MESVSKSLGYFEKVNGTGIIHQYDIIELVTEVIMKKFCATTNPFCIIIGLISIQVSPNPVRVKDSLCVISWKLLRCECSDVEINELK